MSGVTLASLRNGKNLTQRELAEKLDVSLSAIAMYETGARIPSLKQAKKIASFFGKPVEAIIFGHSAHEMQAKQIGVAIDEQSATIEPEPKPAA